MESASAGKPKTGYFKQEGGTAYFSHEISRLGESSRNSKLQLCPAEGSDLAARVPSTKISKMGSLVGFFTKISSIHSREGCRVYTFALRANNPPQCPADLLQSRILQFTVQEIISTCWHYYRYA